ncbi:MAG: hypothetical protein M0Z53_00325 [Thermaerobacter sp.]|nr:hypothetical protein [Thermaerobacter sp.]
MQKFSLVLESFEKAEQATDLLWRQMGVRGEIEVIPLNGQVKVDVVSEKELTAAQLEKLPGKRG